MNIKRKTILKGMIGLGGVLTLGGSYKLYDWYKSPDISYLNTQVDLIQALAEVIIPETDTPGAASANVGETIIHLIQEIYPKPTQNKFVDGIIDVMNYTNLTFEKSFQECTEAEQIKIVEHFQEKAKALPGILGKVQDKFTGKAFFNTLKESTVLAFCTSEIGATQALAYDYIPGTFAGCIPLNPNQAAWATK